MKRPGCCSVLLSVAATASILSSTCCPTASSFQLPAAATTTALRPHRSSSQSMMASPPIRSLSPTHRMASDGAGGDFFDEMSEPSSEPAPTTKPNKPTAEELSAASGEFEDHIPKFNVVTLVGRAGSDPEPRYFDDGKVVLNLSLACRKKYHPLERRVKNIKYGEEGTDWWPLEMWGRDAEYASKYVTKGARIGVTGSLIMDSWQDRNTGEPRKRHKILVKHLDILESKAEAELRRGNQGNRYQGQYYGGDGGGGGGGGYGGGGYEDDGGPSPAGTGGFFDS